MAKQRDKRFGEALVLLTMLSLFAGDAGAQDLEPRRWSHLPTGMNVIGASTVWTDGEIFSDPVARLQDATFERYTLSSSYVRTFEWLGKSSRIDFALPYAAGRWEGLLDGNYVSTRRHGFSDPFVRFSMNLYGAPPLKGMKFVRYRASHPVTTTVGAAVAVTLPFGEYYADRLINLGNNRHVGVSAHMRVPLDAAGILAIGLDPDTLDIIVLKDRVHHRAFWDSVIKVDLPIDAPGIGPADLTTLQYNNIPADIYPVGAKWRTK